MNYLARSASSEGHLSSPASSESGSAPSQVWSVASSQSSDVSSVCDSLDLSDSDAADAGICMSPAIAHGLSAPAQDTSRPGHHFHPRRTSSAAAVTIGKTGCPPGLTRQSDRTVGFVDSLVESASYIVEAIWPLSSLACRRMESGAKGVLPLRTFIQETLRRSRTSYSTLQVALYYLILLKANVPDESETATELSKSYSSRALQCGRRMFLAALILASKYLQDRNYSSRAWSKISGLKVVEINRNETAFLLTVNWKLHVPEALFENWAGIVLRFTPQSHASAGAPSWSHQKRVAQWKHIVRCLTVDMNNIEYLSRVSKNDSITGIDAIGSCQSEMSIIFDQRASSLDSSVSTSAMSSFSEPCLSPTRFDLSAPRPIEPSVYNSGGMAKPTPAFGLLPAPRMTLQRLMHKTPAVSSVCPSEHPRSMAMIQSCLNPVATLTSPVLKRTTLCMSSPNTDRFDACSTKETYTTSSSTFGTPSECRVHPSGRPFIAANTNSIVASPESILLATTPSSQCSRSSSICSTTSVARPSLQSLASHPALSVSSNTQGFYPRSKLWRSTTSDAQLGMQTICVSSRTTDHIAVEAAMDSEATAAAYALYAFSSSDSSSSSASISPYSSSSSTSPSSFTTATQSAKRERDESPSVLVSAADAFWGTDCNQETAITFSGKNGGNELAESDTDTRTDAKRLCRSGSVALRRVYCDESVWGRGRSRGQGVVV